MDILQAITRYLVDLGYIPHTRPVWAGPHAWTVYVLANPEDRHCGLVLNLGVRRLKANRPEAEDEFGIVDASIVALRSGV